MFLRRHLRGAQKRGWSVQQSSAHESRLVETTGLALLAPLAGKQRNGDIVKGCQRPGLLVIAWHSPPHSNPGALLANAI
jgi:hypothetical protein